MKPFLRYCGFLLALVLGLTVWATFADTPTKWLMTPLIEHDTLRTSDVVIVLGSGTRKNGDHLPDQAKDRVLTGLALQKAGAAPYIILSGGLDNNTKLVEATMMDTYAIAHGGVPGTIVLENTSRDTFVNALNSSHIMGANGWGTALVVTSPYHTKRACAIFHKLGVDARCIIAPFFTSGPATWQDRFGNWKSVIREYGAWVYNWMRGTV